MICISVFVFVFVFVCMCLCGKKEGFRLRLDSLMNTRFTCKWRAEGKRRRISSSDMEV